MMASDQMSYVAGDPAAGGDTEAALRGWVDRWGAALVGVLLAALVGAAHLLGSGKPLWYDELFSVIVARQPSWHAMRGAMAGDGNPPLYPLLTKFCMALFGSSDFSVRLPSLAGFLAALVGVYVFVRRDAGPLTGYWPRHL